MRLFKPWALYLWAIIIAVILWLQVHGEGEGTLSLDVPIQLQGLPEHMVIVNNLPSKVKITVQGLQARLKTLQAQDIFMPLNVSDLSEPSVIQRTFSLDDVHLPTGLKIEKVQPDHLELQIDRIVTRTVSVHPNFDLPDEWEVQMVSVTPSMVHIQGPEVWLESLTSVDTLPLKPPLKQGAFELQSNIIVPAEKSVHLQEDKATFKIKGILSKKQILLLTPKQDIQDSLTPIPSSPPVQEPYSEPVMDPYSLPTDEKIILDPYSIHSSKKIPNHTNKETP
ncbi:MAG: CdaR family protein [Mariprofundaceae bacterium]|nr:CdaR family protein [Mariprofundaceae bacterium]